MLRGILSPECPENLINILADMQDARRRTLFSRSSPLRQNRLPLRFQLWPNLRHATQESFGLRLMAGSCCLGYGPLSETWLNAPARLWKKWLM